MAVRAHVLVLDIVVSSVFESALYTGLLRLVNNKLQLCNLHTLKATHNKLLQRLAVYLWPFGSLVTPVAYSKSNSTDQSQACKAKSSTKPSIESCTTEATVSIQEACVTSTTKALITQESIAWICVSKAEVITAVESAVVSVVR
jgi:hypothetical protein